MTSEALTETFAGRESREEVIKRYAEFLESKYIFATLKGTDEILAYPKDKKECKGYWLRDFETTLRAELERTTARLENSGFKAEVISHVKDNSWVDPSEFYTTEYGDKICLENGVLDVRSGRLLAFGPEYHFLSGFKIKYPKDQRYPLFIRALEQIIPIPELRQLAIDYIATLLWQNDKIQRMLWLIGEGSNGKDLIFYVMSRLFGGPDNIAEVSPHEMEENQFAVGRLFGKMVCIDADITAEELDKSGNLKKATGRSPLNCEKKGKDGFPFVYLGGFLFGANRLPPVIDNSDGFMRRPIIVPLSEQFLENYNSSLDKNPHHHNADPDLKEKCTTPEELGYLLAYLTNRLKKIMRIGRIPNAPTIEETRQEWQNQVSFVKEFANAECILGDYVVRSTSFYNEYCEYCESNNKTPLSDRKFPVAVQRTFSQVKHGTVRSGKQVFKGYIGITTKKELVEDQKKEGQTVLPEAYDSEGHVTVVTDNSLYPRFNRILDKRRHNLIVTTVTIPRGERYIDVEIEYPGPLPEAFGWSAWAECNSFFESIDKKYYSSMGHRPKLQFLQEQNKPQIRTEAKIESISVNATPKIDQPNIHKPSLPSIEEKKEPASYPFMTVFGTWEGVNGSSQVRCDSCKVFTTTSKEEFNEHLQGNCPGYCPDCKEPYGPKSGPRHHKEKHGREWNGSQFVQVSKLDPDRIVPSVLALSTFKKLGSQVSRSDYVKAICEYGYTESRAGESLDEMWNCGIVEEVSTGVFRKA